MQRFTAEELDILREGGKRLATILSTLASEITVSTRTDELNARAEELVRAGGDTPAFLNYKPEGAPRPYPATLCVSINEEVVHGIPNESPVELIDGDIVTIDMGLVHKGLITDSAVTVLVGAPSEEAKALSAAALRALEKAVAMVRPGITPADIGEVVENSVNGAGFSVVRELGGHGVGRTVHEEPFIPNFKMRGTDQRIEEGMVLAIEPIVVAGSGEVDILEDGYTYVTVDGSLSAQWEHTVHVTADGCEVLTKHPHPPVLK